MLGWLGKNILIVIAIANSGMQAAGLASLGYYQATVLSKLGEAGRQIQQVVGLAAKIGVGKVERGLQVIKDHPQIVKVGQTAAKAIQTGRKALRQTNRYLKETSRAVAGKVQKIQVGEQIKKIPRACVAKIKQVVDDEAIVVDTWGNTWRSPVNSNHWDVQLSEMGKKNLVLLNEAAAKGGTITVAEIEHLAEGARRFIEIPMCPKTKAIEQKILSQIAARGAQMEAEGVTIGQCLGDKLSKELQHLPFNLDNFEHACLPRIEVIVQKKGSIKYRLTGLHLDEGRQFEKLGFLKMENLEELVGGMYKADIWVYKGYKEAKTFFPSHWNLDTLLSKIKEACHNLESIESSLSDGTIHLVGQVKEGFYINVKLSPNGKILTIYPSEINPLKKIL